MQHMNSVRVPATVIFSALLVVIMISASRTTYKFTTEREANALGPCTMPAMAREPDPARACLWPHAPRAFSQKWPRKVHAWPDSGVDSAAPGGAQTDQTLTSDRFDDETPAQALRTGDRPD